MRLNLLQSVAGEKWMEAIYERSSTVFQSRALKMCPRGALTTVKAQALWRAGAPLRALGLKI